MTDRIIKAAGEHAMQTSEPDHECGDLIDWAFTCWGMLTPTQKSEAYARVAHDNDIKRWLGEEDEDEA